MAANFNNSTPAAIAGYTNGTWQFDGSGNISVCFLTPFFNSENTDIVSLIPGDILVWNGTQWVNALPPAATVDVNGSAVPNANFVNSATVTFSVVGDNISANAAASTTFETNGTPLTSSSTVNFEGDGTYITASNPSAGNVKFAFTGTLPVTIGATAHEWLNSYTSTTGLFTATQPNFTDLAGSIALSQTPLTTAGDLLYANGTPALARLGIGTTGQILTVVAGEPAWATLSTSITWDQIGNAAANLTLANAGYTTTFNQTSGVIWLWANTTVATSSTTNASPLHELAANYWTGSASAADTWSIGSSLAAGTNGASTLTIGHSGSSGQLTIAVPPVTFISWGSNCYLESDNGNLHISTSSGGTHTFFQNGGTNFGQFDLYPSGNLVSVGSSSQSYSTAIGDLSNSNRTTVIPVVALGQNASGLMKATSGTQIGVTVGGGTGGTFGGWLGFTPASGTANFVALQVAPTINQTSTASGSYTALQIAVTETSLKGSSNKLIDCYAGSAGTTEVFAVDNSGKVTEYAGTATVSQGMPSEIVTVDLTAQSAAISATTLISAPATGMYRISWSADITTASDGSSVLGGTNGFQAVYTSPTDSVTKTTVSGNSVTSAANTTGTAIGGAQIVYAKTGTNIQYSFGYTSVQTSTAMVYELHIKLERL